jgi:HEAT repeat protein
VKIQIAPLCLIALLAPAAACSPERPKPVARRVASPATPRPDLTLEELADMLQRGTPERRLLAARALQQLDYHAVPIAVEGLKDEDPAVVAALWKVIGTVGSASKLSLLRLRCALKDHCAEVRLGAATALGDMDRRAGEAAPELIEALGDADLRVRTVARQALRRIGRDAVPALLEALVDGEAVLSRPIIEVLRGIAPEGPDALTSLGEPVLSYLGNGH